MYILVGEGLESWWDIYYSMKYDVNNCFIDFYIRGNYVLMLLLMESYFFF